MSGVAGPWIALCLASAGASPDGGGVTRPESLAGRSSDVERLSSAQAQLRRATVERLKLRSAPPEQLALLRLHAVACLRAVRLYFPESRACVAEASFRAGEILRADGDIEGARAEFEYVRGLGSGVPYRARAGIELGHIERRARRWSHALDHYLGVAAELDTPSRWRDDASIWAGKVHVLRGTFDEGRRLLKHIAASSSDPLERVRAYDEWALSYLPSDDPEASAGVLATCRSELARFAVEETELGARVRDALARMRCIRALVRAIARRNGGDVSALDDDEHVDDD